MSRGTGIRRRAHVQPDRVAVDAEGANSLTCTGWQRRATSVGHALPGAACAGAPGSGPPPDFDGWTATVAVRAGQHRHRDRDRVGDVGHGGLLDGRFGDAREADGRPLARQAA